MTHLCLIIQHDSLGFFIGWSQRAKEQEVSKPHNTSIFHDSICIIFPTVSLAKTDHMAKSRVPTNRHAQIKVLVINLSTV